MFQSSALSLQATNLLNLSQSINQIVLNEETESGVASSSDEGGKLIKNVKSV